MNRTVNNYPNMAYCRYGNTNVAMNQILELMEDDESLLAEEVRAKKNLVTGCIAFLENMGYEVNLIEESEEE